MGLLDRARSTHAQPSALSPGINPEIEHEYPALFQKIQAQTVSVDYGTQIFRTLSEELAIEKGVMFYKSEEKDHFLTLCSLGYDVTTNNRLRLGRSFFEDPQIKASLSGGHPFALDGPLPLLKEFFSTREYGMMERLFCIPIFQDAGLISLLMITGWKEFVPDHWRALFEGITARIAAPLERSRTALLANDVKYDSNETVDNKERLATILLEGAGEAFFVVRLDLNTLFSHLLRDSSGLTAVNIKKEVLSVFKTMSGGDVQILELPNNGVLLVQKKSRIPDIALYLHQLAASLPLLYADLEVSPDLHPQVIEYDGSKGLEELVEELF